MAAEDATTQPSPAPATKNENDLPPASKRKRSASPPRQRKRPGGAARISTAEREAVQRRQAERERERELEAQREQATLINGSDIIASHYNAVPQRGREWRATASTIKNLRSYNNWVKSTLIQKFSPDEIATQVGGAYYRERLKVLDIGCGKGGDLQKWEKAPQKVELYVGVDPASVSIRQAQERYSEMRRRRRGLFQAEFFVKDCYGEWIGEIPLIRNVGIDKEPTRWSQAGFDVVSMMFCMHYAFETEEKARRMLQNVAGALKKGGRFLGVIPNSDVIREKLVSFSETSKGSVHNELPTFADDSSDEEDTFGKRIARSINGKREGVGTAAIPDNQTTEGLSKPDFQLADDEVRPRNESASVKRKHEDTETAVEAHSNGKGEPERKKGKLEGDLGDRPARGDAQSELDPLPEWGNSLYRVRFPANTPKDGVFRPPFGWKYSYFLEEAVEEVPEYVVPWEAFRALAEDYNLELQYRRPFKEVWQEDRNDPSLGPLSVRMKVTGRVGGSLQLSDEELEAVGFYHAFCFYKV